MGCFLVPGTEAIVTTVVEKVVENKENKTPELAQEFEGKKLKLSQKLHWLNNMLWGGSALLAFEHVWHGEVAPFAPFLTAMNNPADAAEMFAEMSTTGVTMAVAVTAVWGLIVAASNAIEKRAAEKLVPEKVER